MSCTPTTRVALQDCSEILQGFDAVAVQLEEGFKAGNWRARRWSLCGCSADKNKVGLLTSVRNSVHRIGFEQLLC